MQRSPSSATVDRSFSTVRVDRGDRPTTGAVPNLVDPSAIYRRLDGQPKPRPIWMTAVAVGVLAVVAAGGVIAFQDELRPLASHTLLVGPGSVSRS